MIALSMFSGLLFEVFCLSQKVCEGTSLLFPLEKKCKDIYQFCHTFLHSTVNKYWHLHLNFVNKKIHISAQTMHFWRVICLSVLINFKEVGRCWSCVNLKKFEKYSPFRVAQIQRKHFFALLTWNTCTETCSLKHVSKGMANSFSSGWTLSNITKRRKTCYFIYIFFYWTLWCKPENRSWQSVPGRSTVSKRNFFHLKWPNKCYPDLQKCYFSAVWKTTC